VRDPGGGGPAGDSTEASSTKKKQDGRDRSRARKCLNPQRGGNLLGKGTIQKGGRHKTFRETSRVCREFSRENKKEGIL